MRMLILHTNAKPRQDSLSSIIVNIVQQMPIHMYHERSYQSQTPVFEIALLRRIVLQCINPLFHCLKDREKGHGSHNGAPYGYS